MSQLEKLKQIALQLKSNFQYRSDGRLDTWVLRTYNKFKGDCEDYALRVAYELSDRSRTDTLWAILISGSIELYYCKANSEGHAVLRYGDFVLESIYQEPFHFEQMERKGFSSVKKYNRGVILAKLIAGFVISALSSR